MADESSMNHQPFDVDAFGAAPVVARARRLRRPQRLREQPFPGKAFWGLYSVMPVGAVPGLHIDLYYLGLLRQNAPYNSGVADETRHTDGYARLGSSRRPGTTISKAYFSLETLDPAISVPGRWLPTPAIPLRASGASRGSGCKPTSRAAAVRAGHSRASILCSRNSRISRRPRSMRPSTSSMSSPR